MKLEVDRFIYLVNNQTYEAFQLMSDNLLGKDEDASGWGHIHKRGTRYKIYGGWLFYTKNYLGTNFKEMHLMHIRFFYIDSLP